MSNTVKAISDYIRKLHIPIVWTLGEVTVTLSTQKDSLMITTDSKNEYCQEVCFSDGDSVLEVVGYLAQATASGTRPDGTIVSEQEVIFDKVAEVLRMPVDIDKVAIWLIAQYEDGNQMPLITRVQEIIGNIDNNSMTFLDDDALVCNYYKVNINTTAYLNAHAAAADLRIALVKLFTVTKGL